MLKQALDAIKQAETDADQILAMARKRAQNTRKSADDKKAEADAMKVEAARHEAELLISRYEKEAYAILEEAKQTTVRMGVQIDRLATMNKAMALNKAVERIVRKNGHR